MCHTCSPSKAQGMSNIITMLQAIYRHIGRHYGRKRYRYFLTVFDTEYICSYLSLDIQYPIVSVSKYSNWLFIMSISNSIISRFT